jgi:hypothetical protein
VRLGRVPQLILLGALAIVVSGSTCDNQDLSGRFLIALAAGETDAINAYRQPYIGRLTVDFGLTNVGETEGTFEIRVQAQTTGDSAATACENATQNSARVLQTTEGTQDSVDVSNGVAATLTTFDRAHFLEFPSGADWAYVGLRIRTTSVYRIYTSAAQLSLLRDDGELLAPDSTTAVECELFTTVHQFTLSDGTYYVGVNEDGAAVLVEEDCGQVRVVPRSCPGANSDAFARETVSLAPGGFVSGRIDSTELGIGDQAVVALSCGSAAVCAGELETFFLVEQLECRTSSDCRGTETCTSEGYCRRAAAGSCSQSTRTPPVGLTLCALSLVLTRRRR